MNQILLTGDENNKKKNNKYKNTNNTNNNDMKKIIIFFGIVILIFGIAISGVYGYKAYNNKNKSKEKVVGKPQLSLEETEEKVTIIAKSEIGIDKVIYTWNEEEPEEILLDGSPNYEKMLDIPGGESTLTVKVIDENGNEENTNKNFSLNKDTKKPIIEVSSEENEGIIKITATDETAMKYITYKWSDAEEGEGEETEEVKVEVENEEDKVIETTIDVKIGKKALIITAVDSSDNTTDLRKPIKYRPIIEVTKSGNKLYMKMSHDLGFKKIEFSVNGTIYKYDENYEGYDSTQKEIEYYFELQEGENIVIIIATSTDGAEATYKGKCNYTSEQ